VRRRGADNRVRRTPWVRVSSRDRNMVVEFKDLATAKACYQSPQYQAAKAIRQTCSEADFIIIEG
jgi:uncharacterized protein (DUF1330 family)